METDTRNKPRPRRILFSISGGYGHFHPTVPLARALKQAGHEVAFAVGASLRPLAEASGFIVLPVGGNMAADPEYRQVKAQLSAMPTGLATEMFAYPRLFCGLGSRLRAPQLVEVARQWQPDIFIREGGEYGAIIAAEHLGLPHVTVAFAAALKTMPYFERDAARQIDPVRQAWGLPPDPDLSALYRYLYLAFTPPSFGMHDVTGTTDPQPTAPIPPTTHFIRPDVFDNPRDERLPSWVEDLPIQPTVYATLGTEANDEPGIYPNVLQTIIAGLRDLPLNLIVTLGRGKDPADFGPQPASVHIEPYIPQSLLLPRCDLMIMHGGSNTLLAAVDTALPMVVTPLIADQFFNAYVTRSMQLGQVVETWSPANPGQLELTELTPTRVRAAVQEVLANPIYRENVRHLQTEMQSLPGIDHAVQLVEQVAAHRQPIPNPTLAI